MKRLLAAIAVLLLGAGDARAINQSSIPTKFNIPWGNSAGVGYIRNIPQPSQIGIQNCAASLTDGFPPLTFTPVAGGGCAPFGQDFNGILKQITQWSQWQAAGGVGLWDSSFSSNVSGYPKDSFVGDAVAAGCWWIANTDGNTTNPDTGGAGWTSACPGGGVGGVSTGSANAQVVTTTPFKSQSGARIRFIAGFTNTSSMQINVNGAGLVNLFKIVPGGLSGLSNGEVQANAVINADFDGTEWVLVGGGTWAFMTVQDQTLSGGANVTSLALATGNITVDCGARPLQYIANTTSWTITAPTNDGSCMLQIENGAGAQIPVFSGFTTNANTGEAIDTTSGHKFVLTIWRIHGVSSYIIKALQ